MKTKNFLDKIKITKKRELIVMTRKSTTWFFAFKRVKLWRYNV